MSGGAADRPGHVQAGVTTHTSASQRADFASMALLVAEEAATLVAGIDPGRAPRRRGGTIW
jgi:hypothetical protein